MELVVQHPNFDNLTQLFSFHYKSLTPYGAINDTAMLWGMKFYNDLLMQAGPLGNVQSELLFRKDPSTFTLRRGGLFHAEFISMVITVSCHLLIHIRICQMLVLYGRSLR
ncbi:hypothetical protein HAX54_009083 [Datura stramonium]|uniref:COBRA C-terminal domain-containing protein n=1 Tax=Datura stramonium TaxID=4076 RepID=A0ABS8RWF8_DATST|nr:hypothetical protein [Datura stramonium]